MRKPRDMLFVWLSVTFLVTLSATYAQTPATGGQTWQYATLVMDPGTNYFYSPDGDLTFLIESSMTEALVELYGGSPQTTDGLIAHFLNLIGSGGWELVDVDGGFFIFKRPL